MIKPGDKVEIKKYVDGQLIGEDQDKLINFVHFGNGKTYISSIIYYKNNIKYLEEWYEGKSNMLVSHKDYINANGKIKRKWFINDKYVPEITSQEMYEKFNKLKPLM